MTPTTDDVAAAETRPEGDKAVSALNCLDMEARCPSAVHPLKINEWYADIVVALAERDTLRAQVQELTKRLKAAETPDMFWDAKDPEIPMDWPGERARDYKGQIFEIMQAVQYGNAFVVVLNAADDADTDDEWEFIGGTYAECAAARDAELNRRAALSQESPKT